MSAAILVFSSCKTDRDARKIDYLTYGNWYEKASMVEADINGQHYNIDLLALKPECERDNYKVFTRTGDVLRNEGLTKCDASLPQEVVESSWMFMNNEQMIHMSVDGIPRDFEILELSGPTLKVRWTDSVFNIPTTHTVTYGHVR